MVKDPSEEGPANDVLHVRVQNDLLSGLLLGPDPGGRWEARLDANEARRELGDVEVDDKGEFQIVASGIDALVYQGGRAVLTLERPGRRARGFLTFTDMIILGRRLGASVGPLLRMTSGSSSDDDLVALLEWFAAHPDESLSPWRTASKAAKPDVQGPTYISIAELEVREANSYAPTSGPTNGPSDQGALDRLLSRLRIAFRATPEALPPAPHSESHAETEDNEDGTGTPGTPEHDPSLDVLEQVWEVFTQRVPLDPRSELLRMADIYASLMMRRRASRERIARFAGSWVQLAVSHIVVSADLDELDHILVQMILFVGLLDERAGRARRRLLRVLRYGPPIGEIRTSLAAAKNAEWLQSPASALIRSVVQPGEIEACWSQVLLGDTPYDELLAVVAFVKGEGPFPTLKYLKEEPEPRLIEDLVRRKRTDLIRVLDGPVTSCPQHGSILPSAQNFRLRNVGLATPDCRCRVFINCEP